MKIFVSGFVEGTLFSHDPVRAAKPARLQWIGMAAACLASLAASSGGRAEPIAWDGEFSGDEIPTAASPRWAGNAKAGGTVQVSDGALDVRVGPGDSRFYTLGFYAEGKPAGDAAWNGQPGTSTVEWRVACAAEDPEKVIFQIGFADGKLRWDVDFRASSIVAGGRTVPVDTSKPDTYRVTLKDGMLQMSSESQGVVIDGLKGRALDDDRNRILFGTDARLDGGSSLGGGSWQLDFIRWTNKLAAP